MEELIDSLFILSIYENKDDYSALITTFNTSGQKVLLKAKGYQKEHSKNRLIFQPFTFVQTEYFNTFGKYKLLKRGDIILKINKNSKTIIFLQEIINELLLREEETNPKIILLIYHIFKNYNNNLDIENMFFFLLIIILKNKKISFELNKCVNCGSKDNLDYLLLYKGGTFCSSCYHDTNKIISYDFLNKFRSLFNSKNLDDLNEINFEPMEEKIVQEILKNYFENELGYNLKNISQI